MKKIFTLLLVILGCVGQVMAAKIYIKTTSQGWWGNDAAVTAISFNNGTYSDMSTLYMYGHKWAVADIPSSNPDVKIARHVGENYYDATAISLGSGTGDVYKEINNGSVSDGSAPSWNILVFRQNIIDWEGNVGNTWTDIDIHNTTHPDGNTFIFTLTKAQIDASGESYIYFRLYNGDHVYYNDAGDYIDGYPQIYPKASDAEIAFGNNTTTYYHNTTSTTWSWEVEVPTFEYEKIVLTAKYVNESGYKWKISADAYINKTITQLSGYSTGYATFGSNASVDFSKAVPAVEGKSFTAYKGNVQSNAMIQYSAITTLSGGEGALLVGDAGTYSIPVAASASADDTNNFKAIDTETELSSSTYYILTNKPASGGTGPLGFYRVNTNGSWCGKNTAYLETSVTPKAREYFPLENEDTSVENIVIERKDNSSVYDLQGRRVANPEKGLYIVNGKKVVIK